MRLPEGFKVGAASSPIQIEGYSPTSDMWNVDWDSQSDTKRPVGDACNSWEMWRDEVDLAAAAGLDVYRFGIEWARIQPKQGFTSKAALRHYREMIGYCAARGIEPLLTLHHFSVPVWFREAGSWLGPDAISHFTDYLAAIAPLLSDGVVTRVATINEPNSIACAVSASRNEDWDRPELFAGLQKPAHEEFGRALIAAHHAARDFLKQAHPHLKVGWTVAMSRVSIGVDDEGQKLADEYFDRMDRPFFEAAAGDDFVGVQPYTIVRFDKNGCQQPPAGAPIENNGWEAYPETLGIAVRQAFAVVGEDVPLFITEHGTSTGDDALRIWNTQGALVSLLQVMEELGVEVLGYTHWALIDNWEFGDYNQTFGLISWDPDTFERTAKPSLAWLGEIAKTGVVPDSAPRP